MIRKPVFALVISALAASLYSSNGQIVPANRKTTWQGNVGVPGGIPNRSTIYQTIPAGASLATVQTAINNCPSNQVVQLSAGNYTFSGTLSLNKSGVTLRGAGPTSTIITFSSGYFHVGNVAWYNDWATPNSARHRNWTNGLAQGSTTIQVAGTGDLAVGMLIFMDQQNDANVDVVGACSGPVSGLYSSVANPNIGQDRWQYQMNRVTAISGNAVTLSEPVYMANYTSSLSPQIWWFGAQPGAVLAGVEDLAVVGSGSGAQNMYFQNAYGCWAKNVSASNARYGFNFLAALRCEMRHCTVTGVSGFFDNYVVQTISSSGLLIEDNISSDGWWDFAGLSGSVIAYNFLHKTTGQSGWMQGGFGTHGANPNMNLFEGNYAPGLWLQNCWGSAEYITALHNRFVGRDEDTTYSVTDDMQAVQVGYWQRYVNIVGNILGTAGVNTWYDDGGTSYTCHSGGRIYSVGISSGGCSTTYDATTRSTLLRAVNWTSATSTNNGVVLDGYSTSSVPNSYYLASKPSYFGNLPWPPYDPANPSFSKTNIPAGYRYVYGVDPQGTSSSGNQAPVASASATPLTGSAPLTVTFSSNGSSDPEGTTLTYSWNFGDSTTSTAANPSHTYSSVGTYSAQLTVSDGTNSVTSSTLTITVSGTTTVNNPPVASESATPATGASPLSVTFSSSGSQDPEGTSLTYSWDFGDGITSTSANPSHTYSLAGDYLVRLTVSDGTNTTTASNITVRATGLVAAYGFEESSGSSVTDAISNRSPGTITAATRVAGKYGNALSFNGSSAVVQITTNSVVTALSSNITIEAWVNPNTSSKWLPVIGKSYDSSQLSYVMNGSTPQNVPAVYIAPSSANLVGTSALPTGTWSHLTVTFDGTTRRLYVNGTLAASDTQSGTPTPSKTSLMIGSDGLLGAYWSGLIDEVRLYNRVLSASEIQADMNANVVSQGPLPPQDLRIISP